MGSLARVGANSCQSGESAAADAFGFASMPRRVTKTCWIRLCPSPAAGERDEVICKLTVVVPSEQFGPLPEIVPPPPPGFETTRMQELVSQPARPTKPTERNRVAKTNFLEADMTRGEASRWRMGRPRIGRLCEAETRASSRR